MIDRLQIRNVFQLIFDENYVLKEFTEWFTIEMERYTRVCVREVASVCMLIVQIWRFVSGRYHIKDNNESDCMEDTKAEPEKMIETMK